MLEYAHAPAESAGLKPVADLLADQLEQVAAVFERQLASDLTAINALCMHIEQYRGKMLRPTLVLLSGLAVSETSKRRNVETSKGKMSNAPDFRANSCETPASHHAIAESDEDLDVWTFGRLDVLSDKHRIAAAVVEMIHMATLVHDDVLDEADVRRGGATVNHLWGNEAAVMLGDYLISNAFHLCSTMGDPAINLRLGEVTNTLCEGELIQLHHRNDFDIDEATYFEIVRRKTASLIGECCRLGSALSGADEAISGALQRFGVALGIAFQIQDDLLDLLGEQEVVGKSIGKDLAKGKLTLPVTHLMASADKPLRDEVLGLIRTQNIASLRTMLVESGSVKYSRAVAHRYVAEAKDEIEILPSSPARNLLDILADNVIARSR